MPTIEGKSYAFSNCHEYFTEPTCNTLTVPLECNLLQSQLGLSRLCQHNFKHNRGWKA